MSTALAPLIRDSHASSPRGVLVIDDDPLVLDLLSIALGDRGFRVWTAQGGRAGVEVFRSEHPHVAVVLLDVRMPGLDGPQTLAELRRIRPDVCCCFISGCTHPYTAEELLALGAAHLIRKPFAVEELLDVLVGAGRRAA
jgi:DNA-binding response OmpR family regulator